jgi:hypothetical protein
MNTPNEVARLQPPLLLASVLQSTNMEWVYEESNLDLKGKSQQ